MAGYINILGIRGVPGNHGGFETFATEFALFAVKQGWKVNVYCQGEEGARKPKIRHDVWQGISRTIVDTYATGAAATIEFDFRCTINVLRRPGLDLVLGYNTAVFSALQRIFGRKIVMNMDGIEWKRKKWGPLARMWLRLNEYLGGRLAHIPIADHPEIQLHLEANGVTGVTTIPYGARRIDAADASLLSQFGLRPGNYLLVIARPEPENSILEIVTAARALDVTQAKLVVLGRFDKSTEYHRRVIDSAGLNTIFPGPIYDKPLLEALRFYCCAYVHGHQVGGTNPSLVEALGASNAVIAHRNKFNIWTAGADQLYFQDVDECRAAMRMISGDPSILSKLKEASIRRHAERFTLDKINAEYLSIFKRLL